jgi:hypothetical protein
MEDCVCYSHIIAGENIFSHLQVARLNSNIPPRDPNDFPIENLDPTLFADQPLQIALDAAAYWIRNNIALRKNAALLVADLKYAALPNFNCLGN